MSYREPDARFGNVDVKLDNPETPIVTGVNDWLTIEEARQLAADLQRAIDFVAASKQPISS
jgi:hypothetical protein